MDSTKKCVSPAFVSVPPCLSSTPIAHEKKRLRPGEGLSESRIDFELRDMEKDEDKLSDMSSGDTDIEQINLSDVEFEGFPDDLQIDLYGGEEITSEEADVVVEKSDVGEAVSELQSVLDPSASLSLPDPSPSPAPTPLPVSTPLKIGKYFYKKTIVRSAAKKARREAEKKREKESCDSDSESECVVGKRGLRRPLFGPASRHTPDPAPSHTPDPAPSHTPDPAPSHTPDYQQPSTSASSAVPVPEPSSTRRALFGGKKRGRSSSDSDAAVQVSARPRPSTPNISSGGTTDDPNIVPDNLTSPEDDETTDEEGLDDPKPLGRGRGVRGARVAQGRARGRAAGAAQQPPHAQGPGHAQMPAHQQGQQRGADVFVWRDGADYNPDVHVFDEGQEESGVTSAFPCGPDASPGELFSAFFDEEVMTHIVEETNNHHSILSNFFGRKTSCHMMSWKPLTVPELYVFFALTMLMAHVRKHALGDYWITGDLISTPAFGKYMSRDRYFDILSYLHLVNNMAMHRPDRLWKIRKLYMMIRTRFSTYLKPFHKVCIDESLVLFRGKLLFRQYIPSKRHRFGIKLFVLCDCKTGYVLDFIVYSGKEGDVVTDPNIGFGGAVVKTMMDRYFGKNHILYTDNYYTSPLLTMFLHDRQTGTVGTVKGNRKGMPKFPVKTKKKDVFLKHSGPVLAIHWHDQRKVNMLTTEHKGDMVATGKIDYKTKEPIYKPDAVLDYNINMRLVDKSDMQVGFIDCLRTSCRWYKKFILHTMDMSVLNAYNIYRLQNPGGANIYKSLRKFQKQVVLDLLNKHGIAGRGLPGPGQTDRLLCAEYFRKHQLVRLPPKHPGSQHRSQRRCVVCAHTTQRPTKVGKTTWQCLECEMALCAGECFNDYHTKQNF